MQHAGVFLYVSAKLWRNSGLSAQAAAMAGVVSYTEVTRRASVARERRRLRDDEPPSPQRGPAKAKRSPAASEALSPTRLLPA
mmetsp:Transcript_12947/g.39917  ORF Transcript_12947/g.39917 Transcript_12947/m.39917 type:complete len:83 (+) Transcript_12947:1145-1393(+)